MPGRRTEPARSFATAGRTGVLLFDDSASWVRTPGLRERPGALGAPNGDTVACDAQSDSSHSSR